MPASFPFGSSLDLDHFVKELFMTYLVTKYRHKAITKEMLERLRVIFLETLEK